MHIMEGRVSKADFVVANLHMPKQLTVAVKVPWPHDNCRLQLLHSPTMADILAVIQSCCNDAEVD